MIWDNFPNAKVSIASISAFLDEGITARDSFIGNKVGDLQSDQEKAA
jgi:isoquinoline 1-oxidoreductase beta subunit